MPPFPLTRTYRAFPRWPLLLPVAPVTQPSSLAIIATALSQWLLESPVNCGSRSAAASRSLASLRVPPPTTPPPGCPWGRGRCLNPGGTPSMNCASAEFSTPYALGLGRVLVKPWRTTASCHFDVAGPPSFVADAPCVGWPCVMPRHESCRGQVIASLAASGAVASSAPAGGYRLPHPRGLRAHAPSPAKYSAWGKRSEAEPGDPRARQLASVVAGVEGHCRQGAVCWSRILVSDRCLRSPLR